MKIHRFYTNSDLNGSEVVINDSEVINQIKNVLRLKTGEQVILFDGQKNEAQCEVSSISKSEANFKVLEHRLCQNEPTTQVTLYCAILKKENFDLVAQKAVETGVSVIRPIITDRTIKTNLKYDRLNKIVKEASEQSGRGIVPSLKEALSFDEAIKQATENDFNLIFDQNGQNFFSLEKPIVKNIGIFIGPEGGFTPAEIEKAERLGFKVASLKALTLRAETAVIVASFLVANL